MSHWKTREMNHPASIRGVRTPGRKARTSRPCGIVAPSGRALATVVAAAALTIGGCSTTSLVEQNPSAVAADASPFARHSVHEAQANAFTHSTQESVTLDLVEDGNVVVAWHSRRQQNGQYGVYARLLNAAGEPIGPEVQVNRHTRGSQTDPAVAVGPGGEAWFAWTSFGQDGEAGAVVARRFDARLSHATEEIPVNVTRAGHQSDPAVAVDDRGRALVVWTHAGQGGSSRVFARLFAPGGEALTGEVELAPTDARRHDLPTVAASAENGFVVAWTARGEGIESSILMRRIDAGGNIAGNVVAVSEGDAGQHVEPSVDVDAAGRIVVAWMHADENGAPAVMARRFDAGCSPIGPARVIETDAPDAWLSAAAVACADDGRFIVTWNALDGDGDELAIHGRAYAPDGRPLADRFAVNRHTAGHQQMQIGSNARRVAWGGGDHVAVGWSGDAGLGDDSAANVTLFTPRDLAVEAPSAMRLAAAPAEAADAPIPPIYDPNWEPAPPPINPFSGGPDFGFMGIDFTGWSPPDPEIAVGPNHLVAMTNGAIAFFDFEGNLLFQDEIEDSFGFWGAQGATGFVFDPECLFDPHSQRFFAMANERASNGRSYWLLAVSDDDNPLGTWHKYRILTTIDNDIDSPNMAVDENVVYLSADFFGPDKYGVLMIEKAPLLTGGGINSQEIVITGSGNQSMGMPINYDTGATAGYLLQSSEGTGNGVDFNEVRFHAIQNQLTNPTRVTVDVNVPQYSFPNQPPQAGTGNRPFLFEPRFWSTMLVGDSMWAVHHVNSSRARARWYEFEMNGWPDSGQAPTLRQWGEIDPDPGSNVHTYFPSIAADEQGNAVIFFSRSSPTEFISIGRAFRTASDPLNTFRPMEFVKESTSPYTAFNRWGDYSHVEPHPSGDGAFWGAHEWTDTSNLWRTWIARVETETASAADLESVVVDTGVLLDGGIDELRESDDLSLHTRSGFGETLVDLHNMTMTVHAVTAVDSPTALDVTVEARIDEPSGTARASLRNWTTGKFDVLGSYPIGDTDAAETFPDIDAADYVSDTGAIELRVRHTVFVPFLAFTFESFVDQTEILVE